LDHAVRHARSLQDQIRGAAGRGALLLGRETYEIFAASWPGRAHDAGFAERMNGIPKYVVTSRGGELAWANSHRVTGELREAIAQAKREAPGDCCSRAARRSCKGCSRTTCSTS